MEINEVLQMPSNTLVILKKDDLENFASACADRILAANLKGKVKEEAEKPIPQHEAIAFLGKSRQTFYSWRKKGIVKAHLIGGRIYYFKSELIAAMS